MVIGIIATILFLFFLVFIVFLFIKYPVIADLVQSSPSILQNEPVESDYDHPYLNTEQEELLQSIGIDPADVPTEITAAQEDCAIEALGAERAQQIISGATPTLNDILKAQHCFE